MEKTKEAIDYKALIEALRPRRLTDFERNLANHIETLVSEREALLTARNEALREAEAVAREEAALCYDTPQIETAEYIADAIHALSEGGE